MRTLDTPSRQYNVIVEVNGQKTTCKSVDVTLDIEPRTQRINCWTVSVSEAHRLPQGLTFDESNSIVVRADGDIMFKSDRAYAEKVRFDNYGDADIEFTCYD
jgi:hypothetical protein